MMAQDDNSSFQHPQPYRPSIRYPRLPTSPPTITSYHLTLPAYQRPPISSHTSSIEKKALTPTSTTFAQLSALQHCPTPLPPSLRLRLHPLNASTISQQSLATLRLRSHARFATSQRLCNKPTTSAQKLDITPPQNRSTLLSPLLPSTPKPRTSPLLVTGSA